MLSKVGLKLSLKCVCSCLIQKTNIANIVCNLCLMKHNKQVIKLVNVIPLYFKGIYIVRKKRNQFCGLIAIRVLTKYHLEDVSNFQS